MRIVTLLLLFFCSFAIAQIPAGYYDNANGLNGEELRTALYDIIKDHDSQSYNDVWSHFESTDSKTGGIVWDVYSDVPGGSPSYTYIHSTDKCGNYSNEGDCYNREHSFPKNWFNDASPMYTDLFALYPTDGYVNNKRGNYPYGEVSSSSWTSTNGSKVGNCSFPGYSGTVFEPIDEYKGDLARTYLYMITRYKNEVSSWSGDMLQDSGYASWALDLLVEWSTNDTVSPKEVDRNEAIYQIQNNRNPFIDHPEWIGQIWETKTSTMEYNKVDLKVWYFNNFLNVSDIYYHQGVLNIYDVAGRELHSFIMSDAQNKYPINNLAVGIYFALIETSSFHKSVKFTVATSQK